MNISPAIGALDCSQLTFFLARLLSRAPRLKRLFFRGPHRQTDETGNCSVLSPPSDQTAYPRLFATLSAVSVNSGVSSSTSYEVRR